MQTIEPEAILEIPESVAKCPYCDTKLSAHFEAWVKQDDGTWAATSLSLDCETEPEDIDSDEWEEWMHQHSDIPYVYMLPVELEVKEWVKENYRFNMEAT